MDTMHTENDGVIGFICGLLLLAIAAYILVLVFVGFLPLVTR